MKRSPYQRLPGISGPYVVPDSVRNYMNLVGPAEADLKLYRLGPCTIMTGSSAHGWHLSISTPFRYPTWDEVAKARYELLPKGATMAMLLPPEDEYINVPRPDGGPNFVLHLWEITDARFGPERYTPHGAE